jgi:ferredoxin
LDVLYTSIRQFTAADWDAALEAILPSIHEVDRDAVRIWSAFFPLALADAYDNADDPQTVARRLRIDGNPRLAEGQVDSSGWFLYGHRHWAAVKSAILARTDLPSSASPVDLTTIVRDVARDTAARAGVEERLVTAIAFVGLMTLRQVGPELFGAAVPLDSRARNAAGPSPDAIVARRSRDDGQGALGFLRSAKRYSVVFDERHSDGKFPIVDSQHLTTAAAADTRDYMNGPRRFQEGPIPAQCRSATCGTCWVGVIGGREKLNEIEPYEARRLREFGYSDARESQPIIRLACQARASGNVTIVIPPWHGFVSRLNRLSAPPAPTGAQR